MYVIYNTVTDQFVGYSHDYLECGDSLICVPVPLVLKPLFFFSFEIDENGTIKETLHATSIEDIFVAEDCLDFNYGEFPIYCSVYARDKDEAMQKVIEMLRETKDE